MHRLRWVFMSTPTQIPITPSTGVIKDLTTGTEYQAAAFADFLREIIARGGLRGYAEEVLAQRKVASARS